MARPSKLTPELQASIVANLETYCHRSIAAKLAGVDPATVRRWMAEGRRDPDGPHGEFCAAILEAESRAERELIRRVADSAKDDPRQAQWLLTHRYPRRWAERDEKFEDRVREAVSQQVTQGLGAFIERLRRDLAPEQIAAITAATKKWPAGQSSAGGVV